MKRAIRRAGLVFLAAVTLALLTPSWNSILAAPAGTAKTPNAGYLEAVAFEQLPGKERVTLAVTKQSGVTVESLPGHAVQVRIDNLYVPEALRRPHADPALAYVVRVTPVQKSIQGRPAMIATIDLKQKVPYSVRQEGMNLLIDFNVAAVTAAPSAGPQPPPPAAAPAPAAEKPAAADAAPVAAREAKAQAGSRIMIDVQDADIKAVLRLLAEQGNVSIVSGEDVKGVVTLKIKDVSWEQALDTILTIMGLGKKQQGSVITVMSHDHLLKLKKAEEELLRRAEEELLRKERRQLDAEPLITRVVPIKYRLLKFVFQNKIDLKRDVLLSAPSRESGAASAAGAKGSSAAAGSASPSPAGATQGKDLPASGSLRETATQKVAVEGAGDFFQLLQSFLSTDADGKQRGWIGADADTNSIIITAIRSDLNKIMDMIEKMDVPTDQVLIKANIVETTKSTARNLGIQWGGMWGQKIGNQGLYITPGGTGGSTTPPGNAFSGGYTPTSGSMGMAGQGFGVNFPAASLGGGTASLGMMFGTIGGNILDLQLSALQKDGKLNILSSPSLVTLDNQMASTENGDEVPFVTPGTSTSQPTVTWKKAGLKLEITPHVIDGKNIKMSILVKKDELDFSRKVEGNPVIIQKETKTDLVVGDGETIVISGLTKQKNDNTVNGIPWLKEIPVFGWLFKGEGSSESMEEVLIFITPSIIKQQQMTGIQTVP